jgi:uncharacterized protein
MLFGAGVLLFTSKAIEKGRRSGPLHDRRMFWLLVFGMMHGYLVWYGDILVAYALCGMLAFVFRKAKISTLLVVGAVFFVVPVLLSLFGYATMDMWPQESIDENLKSWKPALADIAKEIELRSGSWTTQMEYRVPMTIFMETFVFFWFVFWRVLAMMLLGMALFKSGVLSAAKSNAYYIRMTLIGLVCGLALSSMGVYQNFEAEWEMGYSRFVGSQFNYFGSIFTALGYIGIVMLIAKSHVLQGFKKVMSAVGKMAFTNYILMSMIGMFIFYGNGLALFSQVERSEQMLFIAGVWIVMMIISPLWLKHFRFGPLEWLWRVLTYMKMQPFKKASDSAPSVTA